MPLCSFGLVEVGLWWGDGSSDGPRSTWAGYYLGSSSCSHLSVLLYVHAVKILSCNLTVPSSVLNVVQRVSSSRKEGSWFGAHHGSVLKEWQDCTEIVMV